MARIRISLGSTPEQTARELASIGVTMGQQLQDGSYRVYVRKENMKKFVESLTKKGP